MANYATLKAAIQAAIRTNGQQQITGQSLQTQLVNMVTALGKFFQSYGGVVTSASTFAAGDENVLFFATEAGTYTDFGGAVLDGKTLHILYYDGSWHDADTSIPSGAAFEAALALAIKGSQSGIAEGIADTISAGTAQEFLQRQSGGDGVNCIKRIKGKTIAWNQLVDEDTTEVTIPSGHKYFAIIGGTASVATSDGTAIAVTGGVDVVTDLTLLGLGDLTADQFRALYPALYAANPGVLKSNDAAALLTDGRNQWDEEWEKGRWDFTNDGQKIDYANGIRCANYIRVFGNTEYYFRSNEKPYWILWYDADKNFISTAGGGATSPAAYTAPSNAAYMTFCIGSVSVPATTYNNDICINLSDPSFNGTYEPYWKRVLALRLSELTGIPEGGTEADRVTMFPNGLGGAGSAFDSIFVENGVTKARKTMGRVDLGTLTWTKFLTSHGFYAALSAHSSPKAICSKYVYVGAQDNWQGIDDKECFCTLAGTNINICDYSHDDTSAGDFKTAMSGVYLEYELATPIVYTDLQYADGTPFTMPATILVDNYGTERIQAPEGATSPSAPFCCDSNYSIGVANLVKRLAALENAE